MEINKEIGAKVRSLRESKGLTLREVATALDMDYGHLGRLERGTVAPSMKKIQSLADYFQVDTSYFFGEKGEVPDELKEVGVEWVTFIDKMKRRNLTPEEIEKVLDIVEKLK